MKTVQFQLVLENMKKYKMKMHIFLDWLIICCWFLSFSSNLIDPFSGRYRGKKLKKKFFSWLIPPPFQETYLQ